MQTAMTLTQTSVGKKALVAVTGVILFGFVVGHMAGNLQVFLGAEALNGYAEMLHSMPKALWAARIVLLVSVITHIALTIQLAMQNKAARPSRYRIANDVGAQSPLMKYARKTMILSGPIVAAFIAFHLAHLTFGANVVPGHEFSPTDVYSNVVHGFRSPLISGFYIFANLLLGLHLYHGGHALFQSLGLRNPRIDTKARLAAMALAAVVTVGNVAMPLAILFNLVGSDVPAVSP